MRVAVQVPNFVVAFIPNQHGVMTQYDLLTFDFYLCFSWKKGNLVIPPSLLADTLHFLVVVSHDKEDVPVQSGEISFWGAEGKVPQMIHGVLRANNCVPVLDQ